MHTPKTRARLLAGGQVRNQGAFTLLELLTATAIIALLAVLGAGVFQHVQRREKIIRSLDSLRALGAASLLYSAENEGALPPSDHAGLSWRTALRPFLGGADAQVYRNPLDLHPTRSQSYAINDYLTHEPYGAEHLDFTRRAAVPEGHATLLFAVKARKYAGGDHFHFADAESGASPAAFAVQVAVELASGEGHYLFVDGHVEAIPWEQLKQRLQQPDCNFTHPDPGT